MSFLAPFFLAALGAISLPILLHLIRRTPRDKVTFSSLMFLSATPPRLTKRSSIEHWLLLFLRALAVVLIALAFARPFLWEHATAEAEETGPGRRIILLLDTSASMQREDLWTQAKQAADHEIAGAQPTDALALMAFDRATRRIVSFEQWSATPIAQRTALMQDALASLAPGAASTNLGDALIAAADSLGEAASGETERTFTGERLIVLISDLQDGGDLKPLDGYDWLREVKVKLARVAAKAPTNAGVQIIADRDNTNSETKHSLRLRVSNAKNSAREQFTLRFEPVNTGTDSIAPKAMEIYVPPGESRIFRTADLSAWWSAAGNAITLEGDEHPFDNRVFHSTAQPAEAVIVYVGNDDAKDTKGLRFYLELAFPPTNQLITKVIPVKPEQPLPPGETDGSSLLVIGSAPTADRVNAIRKRAEDGATLLVVLRESNDVSALASLLNAPDLTTKEATVRDYAMLSEIDFKHPLFAPFADPRFGDFTKIRFWKHRTVDATTIKNSRVLAKFDEGSPAFIEAPLGKGRCLILTAGWHPADGQFALSSKFVPLMNVLLQQSLGQPASASHYTVGDPIDLAWLANSPVHRGKPVRATSPKGEVLTLDANQHVTKTDDPGIHTIHVGEEIIRIAFNLAASESETAPLPADEFEKRGVALWQSTAHLAGSIADEQRQMRINELENKHKLWRWLIVAAIGVLMIETLVAGRSQKQ